MKEASWPVWSRVRKAVRRSTTDRQRVVYVSSAVMFGAFGLRSQRIRSGEKSIGRASSARRRELERL